MSEVFRLTSEGGLAVSPLVGLVQPVEAAPAAYAALQDPAARPLMALLRYDRPAEQRLDRTRMFASAGSRSGKIRLAVVGGGAFAQGMHLPNLKQDPSYAIRA